jgi:hypothetical protein
MESADLLEDSLAKDVAGMTTAMTLAGPSLTIDAKNGVRIDSAKVLTADVAVGLRAGR